jgi:hypothetical protein
VNVSRLRARLFAVAASALLTIFAVPVVALGEPDGPKLAFVGSRPVKGEIENGVVKFGVTVRNDSEASRRAAMERRTAGAPVPEADVATAGALQVATIAAAPPALPGPALTSYLVTSIRMNDWVVFIATTAIARIAYFAGIYTDTWGSPIDYLTAFAAGAGTTFAANWKLLPWYSSTKPAAPAPEDAAA